MLSWNKNGLRAGRNSVAACMLALLAGCAGESSEPANDSTAATLAWSSQPEMMVAQDLKAASPTEVWVADDLRDVVARVRAGDSTSMMFGFGDSPPEAVVEPLRIAVAPTIGIVAYDGTTGALNVLTHGGRLIRSFVPEFRPAYLDITSSPIAILSAVRHTDVDGTQRLLVLSTNLTGADTDMVVGPDHGPTALQALSPDPRETSISASDSGMWIWTRSIADTIYHVGVQGPSRTLVIQEAHRDGLGMLHDRSREVLWIVRQDTAGYRYAGYDVGLEGAALGPDTYIGSRTTPPTFTPKTAIDGFLIGTSPEANALVVSAYDMGLP